MGRIEVFMGPMFAGKTTALIRRIEELISEGKSVKVFKAVRDNRYAIEKIKTHDGKEFGAYNIHDISEVKEDADVIAIDEFHFFKSNLLDYIKKWKNEGKIILLTGLDLGQDGEYKKFIDLKKSSYDLRKISDKTHILTSICAICGKKATMTQRLVNTDEYSFVGGAEAYRPVCEEHHPNGRKNKNKS